VWAKLEERWGQLVDHARRLAAQTGAMDKYERRAAHEIIKLGEKVEPRKVINTILAMCLMEDFSPRRFRSDQAFRFQLVRRVRSLTDMNVGTYWDNEAQRVKRVYKVPPIRTTAILGQWLVQVVGGVAGRLAQLERADEEKQRNEAVAYRQAVEELV
jgi:hypothetical protein